LEAATRALFDPGDRSSIDFLRPAGEAAPVSPDSVSWRAFKNPLSLFIGGVTAVTKARRSPLAGLPPALLARVDEVIE
jgi:uncharacterized protein (DUF2236 family)